MKIILTILLSTWALTSFAGDKGNIYSIPWDGFYGGDAVVCRKGGKIISSELLDYVEMDPLIREQVYIYEKQFNNLQFVNLMATKLERISMDVFLSFRREAVKLATYMTGSGPSFRKHPDIIFYTNKKIDQIPDTGRTTYPVRVGKKGCTVEQLVIRHKRYNRVAYYIQADVFNMLSPRDKRGLILHEAIYHSFNMFYGDFDSSRTRYFNRRLMTRPLNQLTQKTLQTLLQNAYIRY